MTQALAASAVATPRFDGAHGADGADGADGARARYATKQRQSFSLQARIALTVALLAALMLAIGGFGLQGGYKANRANRDTYQNKLAATMNIGAAELLIARMRLVLGAATANVDDAITQRQIARATEYLAQSDDAWRRFVGQPHEPGEAPLIEAANQHREALRNAMLAFMDALKKGERAAADQIGTVQLSPLFNELTTADEALKRTLYTNAQHRYEEAEHYFSTFLVASAALIAVGLLAAVISWMTLRRAIMRPLDEALGHFTAIAAGDLSRDIDNLRADEMGQLLAGLQTMQTQLSKTVTAVRDSCEAIGTATREIAAGTLDLSTRTEEQAASLEETAASMSELTATVKQNAEHAQQARGLADDASMAAQGSSAVIGRMTGTMSRIDVSSRKIADITGIIDGIAFQTNILALNAAVEAARAGEHGRGFAVVAAEVRALAQHSSSAAKQIGELVADSVSAAADGTVLATEAEQAMHHVLDGVQRFALVMNEIVAAALEQRTGIEQVDTAISLMDSITQQNAALVEQASAAAQALDQQSQELARQVAVFSVR
ncbi:methyl-accepting chemotaxis protein [Paraburkholderia rhizosphaerae]|uniref:Methyl-accepting chemotaxis sensory transducer with TarH sensor n=1 Tax=Paraburkholderia rhizosphaerae TaxID=480658 RepID=A0A4R8M023_9BURK|nr:methyl-accepting chemotaxis protein [Paraburkholderia rhizosphaerae]TDY54619.1 methyl-accepting chemotaxis sensory transducer with TarH sensor [Paraburkholderia rhizosphaerae]